MLFLCLKQSIKSSKVKRSLLQTTGKVHGTSKAGREQFSMTGKIEGKKSRGPQCATFLNSLNTWATNNKMKNTFGMASGEKKRWRAKTINACSRQDT